MRFIITGAASGIGAACAELLADGTSIAGDHQMLLADRDAANLAAVANAIGARAATAVVDLTELDWGTRIVDAAIEQMGGIDAVIADEGVIMGGALADLAPEHVHGGQAAVNSLVRRAWRVARRPCPLSLPYAADPPSPRHFHHPPHRNRRPHRTAA